MQGFLFVLTVVIVVMSAVQSNDDIMSVLTRVDVLNADLIRLKKHFVRVEDGIFTQLDLVKISLRSELKQYVHQYVADAMKEIIQGESIEEMVRSQVKSEVRKLKRENHKMKRQLHRVLTSYRDLQEDVNTCKEAMKKADRDAINMKTCSKYIVDFEILRRDLKHCRDNTENCQQRETQKDKDLLKMEYSLKMLNKTCLLQHTNIDTFSTERITSPTTSTTPVTTSVAATAKPNEENRRIIAAPWYNADHHFRQVNLGTNIVSTYPLRSLKAVSMIYISKLKKLLIGLANPDTIISSKLDSCEVTTVRENVETYGMAVDDERELIFMTTYQPRQTISRMTTQGKNFTTITDLAGFEGAPFSIAVITTQRTIYACNFGKLLMVTYDGLHLQILATGSSMFAVTVDNIENIVYYNDYNKLMSYSQNVTREVATLSVQPRNIKYYNKTVYISSHGSTPVLGAVDVTHDTVMYTLQQNIIKNVNQYVICLVP